MTDFKSNSELSSPWKHEGRHDAKDPSLVSCCSQLELHQVFRWFHTAELAYRGLSNTSRLAQEIKNNLLLLIHSIPFIQVSNQSNVKFIKKKYELSTVHVYFQTKCISKTTIIMQS